MRQALEIDERRLELGVLGQRPARRRDDALDASVGQSLAQNVATHQSRRADEQQLHAQVLLTALRWLSILVLRWWSRSMRHDAAHPVGIREGLRRELGLPVLVVQSLPAI